MKVGKENAYKISGTFSLEEEDKCASAAVEHVGLSEIVFLNP